MCGIAGVAGPGAAALEPAVRRAVEALRHRGPDGEGVRTFSGCVLGNARLAIVDLDRGAQPMSADDGLTAVTFNGAIYGFRELRPGIERWYPLRTCSDTEILLALYRRHGRAMLDHLPGMFAFALWDEREQTLFAARDRFGEKPFYWARGPEGELVFASEIRALLATGLVEPELDPRSLAEFLHLRYVPPDRTIWRNVGVLPPAHSLTFQRGTLEVRRYWELPPTDQSLRPDEALDQFRSKLERAVAQQTVADVPVAFFLSGGLDSSTVVAIAARERARIRTVTLDCQGSSDSRYAREVAARYGTDHLELSDREVDLGDAFVRMAGIFDEPLSDRSHVATWLVCREARHFAKVMVSGEGGDELLAGYPHVYRVIRGMELWSSRPAALRWMASVAERVANRAGISQAPAWRRLVNGATAAARVPSVEILHRAQVHAFGSRELAEWGLPAPDPPALRTTTLDDVLRRDVTGLLPGDWLVRTDRTSMANGMELRSPFLDVDFASFCIALPSRLKIDGREEKWILRRAFEAAWPRSVARRSKQGFGPSDAWLDRPDLVRVSRRIFEDPLHPVWNLLPFADVMRATGSVARRRWVILTLGLWAERWTAGRARAGGETE